MFRKILFSNLFTIVGQGIFMHAPSLYYWLYSWYKRKDDDCKIRMINLIVRPGDLIFYIGANIGFYSDLLSKITGESGEVHVFEPEGTNYRFLTANTSSNKNITYHNCAVGRFSGKTKLYKSSSLNVDHRTYQTGDSRETVDIQQISLDDFWLHQEREISFIKIDIQGFEYDALRGMEKILGSPGKPILLTELWPWGLKVAGSSPELIIRLLQDAGYSIYLIKENDNTLHSINLADQWEYKESIYHDLLCIPVVRESEVKEQLVEFIRV